MPSAELVISDFIPASLVPADLAAASTEALLVEAAFSDVEDSLDFCPHPTNATSAAQANSRHMTGNRFFFIVLFLNTVLSVQSLAQPGRSERFRSWPTGLVWRRAKLRGCQRGFARIGGLRRSPGGVICSRGGLECATSGGPLARFQ